MERKELNTRWKALDKQLIDMASKILAFVAQGSHGVVCKRARAESIFTWTELLLPLSGSTILEILEFTTWLRLLRIIVCS